MFVGSLCLGPGGLLGPSVREANPVALEVPIHCMMRWAYYESRVARSVPFQLPLQYTNAPEQYWNILEPFCARDGNLKGLVRSLSSPLGLNCASYNAKTLFDTVSELFPVAALRRAVIYAALERRIRSGSNICADPFKPKTCECNHCMQVLKPFHGVGKQPIHFR